MYDTSRVNFLPLLLAQYVCNQVAVCAEQGARVNTEQNNNLSIN
jgi:hypothetical protein